MARYAQVQGDHGAWPSQVSSLFSRAVYVFERGAARDELALVARAHAIPAGLSHQRVEAASAKLAAHSAAVAASVCSRVRGRVSRRRACDDEV